jgi:hypothetical protein
MNEISAEMLNVNENSKRKILIIARKINECTQ